jgi:hypothetical protein
METYPEKLDKCLFERENKEKTRGRRWGMIRYEGSLKRESQHVNKDT